MMLPDSKIVGGESPDRSVGHVRPEIEKIFFKLQEEIEKSPEGMDYRVYASRLWTLLGLSLEDPAYSHFERELVLNMRRIPMEDLVHGDLRDSENLQRLLEMPGELVLWSRGDAEKTRYQVIKILRSRLRSRVLNVYKRHAGLKMKLSDTHIVAQDKVKKLRLFLEKKLSEGVKYSKIVVLEDSVSAFADVQRLVEELGMDVPVLPVWFAGTRVGTQMKKADPVKYISTYRKYHGVQGFNELLSPEMQKYLQPDDQTLWLDDFDGVNADNRVMRQRQYAVKVDALKKHSPYKTEEELLSHFKEAI